ncbi:MAG TPA: type II secretion system F family protein [bacterium]|nr:type II secretion system F family protein [bacterium]
MPGFILALWPLAKRLSVHTQRLPLPGVRERYAHQIERAGLKFELTADVFLVLKIAGVLVMTGLGLIVVAMTIHNGLLLLALIFVGFVGPDLWLSSAIRKQELACTKALPGFLDLLALSVEAGMGFDAAVLRLTQTLKSGPLTWRLQTYLRSMSLGKSRSEALKETARKMDLPDFTSFANAVAQATDTGASLGPVLRAESADLLERRFQRAEKSAYELSVKMLFPLFVFIFPATFIMILGPMYFQFMSSGAAGSL